jgi:uncharacterized protein with HEPN domain
MEARGGGRPEQLRQVSPAQQAALPQIPWRTIVQTRNRIAHNYGRVDIDILDGIVQSDLPDLIGEIDAALANG